jgi:hypothetical protein
MILFHFVWASPYEKNIKPVRSAIEDLAFPNRSLRVTKWGCLLIVGEYVLNTIELKGQDPDEHGNRD